MFAWTLAIADRHYWVFACVAAVGRARGGGQMKDDWSAAGVCCRQRERDALCPSVFFCVSQ